MVILAMTGTFAAITSIPLYAALINEISSGTLEIRVRSAGNAAALIPSSIT